MAKFDKKAEEKAIHALDAAWGDACCARDAKAVAAFYAQNGTCVWPEQKAVYKRPAILKAWKKICEDSNLKLRFFPKRITFSRTGDLASDFGVVKGQFTGPTKITKKGKKRITKTTIIRPTFKYLVVWTKVTGKWMVLFDCYNYDKPTRAAPGGG